MTNLLAWSTGIFGMRAYGEGDRIYYAYRVNHMLPWELTVCVDRKIIARSYHETITDAKSVAEEIERKETS